MATPAGVGTLYAVWGTSPTSVFAVGDTGAILHYDGSAWTRMPTPSSDVWRGISGTGNDVWVVGGCSVIRYDGTTWTAVSIDATRTHCTLSSVWGASRTDVFVVGGDFIFHFDGSSSSIVGGGPEPVSYTAVWGSGPADVYAVGYHTNEGVTQHYDGKVWGNVSNNWFGGLPIFWAAVWGTGPTDVYAAGRSGMVHYDGKTWSAVGVTPANWVSGCSASDDVFTLASDGNVGHFDGQNWTLMSTGVTAKLFGIWASGSRDAFVVGEAGTILHYSCCPP